MRSLGLVAIAVTAALLLAPLAAAGPIPALYFLKDGETPLVGDGILNQTAPDGLDPTTRLVLPGSEDVPNAVFRTVAPVEEADRLLGPLLVGLWTGPSTVIDGNITATIYLVEGDEMTPLGSAGIALQINESSAPDPMSLVPPDPTDPEQAAAYIAAQAMAGLITPPVLLQQGFVDVEVPEGATLAVGFYLEATPGSGNPAPIGGPASIRYDASLTPTFVYAPWYKTDPEPTRTTTQTSSNTATTQPTGGGGQPTLGGSGGEEESPGAGMLAIGVLVVGLVAVRRRLGR